jgi:hypothetical protein
VRYAVLAVLEGPEYPGRKPTGIRLLTPRPVTFAPLIS